MRADPSGDEGRAPACLLSTCGLPGAGKSTLARGVAKRAESDGIHVTLVSFDDVERRLLSESRATSNTSSAPSTSQFDATVWKAARVEALSMVQQLLRDGSTHEGEEEGTPKVIHRLVIADDNFYYAGMRQQCHRLSVNAGAAHVTLFVETSVENAHVRNEKRPLHEVVPREALNRMADAFEPPVVETATATEATSDEKKSSANKPQPFERDTVVHVMADTLASSSETDTWHSDIEKVWVRISEKWVGPASLAGASEDEIAARKVSGSAANAASATHALDIRSRKTLASVLAKVLVDIHGTPMDGKAKGALSKKLNEKRRAMVETFRVAANLMRARSNGDTSSSVPSNDTKAQDGDDTADLDAEITFVAEMARRESEFNEACRVAGEGVDEAM